MLLGGMYMDSGRYVKLENIINEFSLEVLYGGEGYKDIKIYVDSVGNDVGAVGTDYRVVVSLTPDQ